MIFKHPRTLALAFPALVVSKRPRQEFTSATSPVEFPHSIPLNIVTKCWLGVWSGEMVGGQLVPRVPAGRSVRNFAAAASRSGMIPVLDLSARRCVKR